MNKKILIERKINKIRELIKELRQLTKSKVVLVEAKAKLNNTTLLKAYIDKLLRKYNAKEEVLLTSTPTSVIVKNKNRNLTFDDFKPPINYLIDKRGFINLGNKLLGKDRFLVLKDSETGLSVYFQQ